MSLSHSKHGGVSINFDENGYPYPDDFVEYLPWACERLEVYPPVYVTKEQQQEYVGAISLDKKSKKHILKKGISQIEAHLAIGSVQEQQAKSKISFSDDPCINVTAVYDSYDNLVQLRFLKNPSIPRLVLKIIGLIVQYQIHLNSVTIDKGMDEYTLYEISKFLPTCHITELCLDGTALKHANYYLLLEEANNLKQLSLARCDVNDKVFKTIAELLAYPQPASKSLMILNLSSNRITDIGAKYIAESLRTNRQLCYLNLADNMITDTGAEEILNVLKSFPLSFHELLVSRTRYMAYLKHRNELVAKLARELRFEEPDKRSQKRKNVKPSPVKKKDNEPSLIGDSNSTNWESAAIERAEAMAENILGVFSDPFEKSDTFVDDTIVYSYGNNTLCYINLSYNNLSYMTLKKLAKVLEYQKEMDRKPRGLVNVSIEGNCLPMYCEELFMIDKILHMNLTLLAKTVTLPKKKLMSKPSKNL